MNYFLGTFFAKVLCENEIINEIEKRMVEELIEKQDDKEIMSAVKKSFRKMKVEGKKEHVDMSNESKTFYANNLERSRYGSWKTSRDFKDFSRTSQEIDGESLNLVTGLSLGLSPESPNQNLCL